jgi:hypothetical protein
MSDNVTAKSGAPDARALPAKELSPAELDAVSGGWSISFLDYKVTGGDVAGAAKSAASWLWNHI